MRLFPAQPPPNRLQISVQRRAHALPEIPQQGLFVGSRVIEAGCKTLIATRLKRSECSGPFMVPMRASLSDASATVVNSTTIGSPVGHDCPMEVAHPSEGVEAERGVPKRRLATETSSSDCRKYRVRISGTARRTVVQMRFRLQGRKPGNASVESRAATAQSSGLRRCSDVSVRKGHTHRGE
jgi:hypothetical protein